MRIRFWGTRGSLPKPGPTTLRYGGNTSCVEVRTDDGTLLVFDRGTGSHNLGQALAASDEQPVRGHLLISHTHWDHIQGFPFFRPLFVPGNEWDVYAPGGLGHRASCCCSRRRSGKRDSACSPRATARAHRGSPAGSGRT